MLLVLKLLLLLLSASGKLTSAEYEAYRNPTSGYFGLKASDQTTPCLQLQFSARLFFASANSTWTTEKVPAFTSDEVTITGYCAANFNRKSVASIEISWIDPESNDITLQLNFITANVKDPVKQLEELRWQMNMTYSALTAGAVDEYFSPVTVMSAPLNQKFICRDRINITLQNSRQQKVILELQPDISLQPYSVSNKQANFYVCERTRRRTLTESFNNRMTIFSGFVLGVSSISMLVTYSFKRQLHPSRQHLYQPFD